VSFNKLLELLLHQRVIGPLYDFDVKPFVLKVGFFRKRVFLSYMIFMWTSLFRKRFFSALFDFIFFFEACFCDVFWGGDSGFLLGKCLVLLLFKKNLNFNLSFYIMKLNTM